MAAEESSSTNQQFTLDHFSFEKLLAAAWVLQCVQDQMETAKAKRLGDLEPIAIVNNDAAASSQFSVAVTLADSRLDAPPAAPATCGTFMIPAEVEQSVSIQQPRQAVFDLRNASNRVRNSFNNRLPTVRVSLTLRGLRAVGIATPVWVLSLLAALLFLEVWRHDSTQSAQATMQPIPAVSNAAVTNITPAAAPTPAQAVSTTPKPAISKRVEKTRPPLQLSKASSPLEVSHKQITDPAAFFAVQQLSRYEIETLRRQAKYGDDSAAFALGMAYEVGHLVPQNCGEAAGWVASAAKAGNRAAQYNMGLRYRDGDGVPANLSLSASWLRKAAAHRNKRANLASKLFASH